MVKLTQLDLLSSPMGGAGTGSQQNEETKPEFKMTASIKLTKIDEEVKISETFFFKYGKVRRISSF